MNGSGRAWARQLQRWTQRWTQRWYRPPTVELDDRQRAQALITAVDAGGVPLHPARVNDIARRLGLEVSTRAPVEETIERIRQALQR
jgi:hypothetical protein